MRTSNRSASRLCLLLVTASFALPTAPGSSTISGPHVRIVCDFDDDAAAREALTTAEAAWDAAAAVLSAAANPQGSPCDVHLYETIAAYEAVDASLNAGRFRPNLAFALPESKTAHLVVQPPLSPELRKKIGLPALTRRLIAHETAHLVRYTHFPNHPSHPDWFADGVALLVQQIVVGRLEAGGSPQDDPEWSTKNARARRLLAAGKLPALRELLSDGGMELERLDRYAVRGLAVQFLATGSHRPQFERLVAEARQLGGGSDFKEDLLAVVEQVFDDPQLQRLGAEFQKYAQVQDDPFDETYRSLEIRKDGYVQVAFPDANAIAWFTDPLKADKYRITGQLEFLPATNAQMNVMLGRTADGGFVSVAFTAGFGVNVFDYDSRTNAWNQVGSAQVPEIQREKPLRFAVLAQTGRVTIEVNGKECLAAELPNRQMNGQVGLGAQAGAAGRWNDVRRAAEAEAVHNP